jgi:hypothetical protein
MSNVISSMTVLMAVHRTFKFPDRSWMNDAMHSIGDAIKSIGTYLPMEKKSKCLQVSNRRAMLPKDFNGLLGISKDGVRIPFSSGVDTGRDADLGYGYKVNPGYLLCPFTKGTVDIQYVSIPRDEKGLPLILNQQDYIDAIKWKVIADLLLGGYEHKVISWKEADQRWEQHAGRAANAAKMPTRDEMETFGNNWNRLFKEGTYMDGFARGLEFGEDTIVAQDLPKYRDVNKLI